MAINSLSDIWLKDLKIQPEFIKLLKEILRGMLHDMLVGGDFCNITAKVQATKAIIDKWDYIKLKRFCIIKETISIVKRQHTKWEKIFLTILELPDPRSIIKNI